MCVVVAVLTTSLPARAEGDDPCAEDLPAAPPAPVVAAPSSTFPVRGKLRQKSDGQGLVGGTVTIGPIMLGAGNGDIQTAISDENGDYVIHVPPGRYTITVYYLDQTKEIATNIVVANQLDVGDTLIDENQSNLGGCVFWTTLGPEMTARPYFGLTVPRNRVPVSRDRTHVASLSLVPAADPRTVVTSLERGVRLHGAPGIPTLFVEETSVSTLRTEITHRAGSGGAADIALRSGSNETKADARLVLGLDRTSDGTDHVAAQQVFLGAPIVKDKAWIALGLAADVNRQAHGFLRLNYAATHDHQGEMIALAQDAGPVRDGWAQGRWTSKFLDYRLQIRATATAERLEHAVPPVSAVAHAGSVEPGGPGLVQRVGGALDITYRLKALGHHNLMLLAASGAGSIDGDRHDDLSLAAGDSWQIRPNIELEVGARRDTRSVADARTTIVSPRVSLAYDLTQEGRSDLFVAYQRVPHLDDGFLGAWRGDATMFHDELAVGISHMPYKLPSLMVGIAGRAQQREGTDDVEGGLDGWLRIEKNRTFVHVAASTLRRAGVLQAQRTLREFSRHSLAAATTLRTAQVDADHVVTEGGAAFAWSWLLGDKRNGGKVNTTLELYEGTLGPGARLVLGGTW